MFTTLLLLVLHLDWALAALRNITIDDTTGDGEGRFIPQYQPRQSWEDQTCETCFIQPDTSLANGGTFHAATYDPRLGKDFISFSITFQGSAIYFFFILANENPRATTATYCNFTLDGQPAGSFIHLPDETTSELEYNQLSFSRENLAPDEDHTITASMSDGDTNYWLAFDYALLTVETPDSSSSSSSSPSQPSASSDNSNGEESSSSSQTNIGAIVGGILGGLAVIIAAILIWFFCVRKRQRENKRAQNFDIDAPSHLAPAALPLMLQNNPSHAGSSTDVMMMYGGKAGHSTLGRTQETNQHSQYETNVASMTSPSLHPSHGRTTSDTTNTSYLGLAYDASSTSGTTPSAAGSAMGASRTDIARRETLRDVRQRQLEQQVELLKQQLDAMRGGGTSGKPGRRVVVNPDSPSSAIVERGGVVSPKQREAEEAERVGLRNQVTEMQQRIRELENVQTSPWAQGYSDEPPPGYSHAA